jgi:hypothetical protein
MSDNVILMARLHSGAMVAGGDGLGAADDVLVVIGMLIVSTRPVRRAA